MTTVQINIEGLDKPDGDPLVGLWIDSRRVESLQAMTSEQAACVRKALAALGPLPDPTPPTTDAGATTVAPAKEGAKK